MPLGSGETLIGRSRDCQVSILGNHVSRVHARLVNVDGEVTLEDMGSRNGVFLNGIRMDQRTVLKDGDSVLVGTTELIFFYGSVDSIPPPERVVFDDRGVPVTEEAADVREKATLIRFENTLSLDFDPEDITLHGSKPPAPQRLSGVVPRSEPEAPSGAPSSDKSRSGPPHTPSATRQLATPSPGPIRVKAAQTPISGLPPASGTKATKTPASARPASGTAKTPTAGLGPPSSDRGARKPISARSPPSRPNRPPISGRGPASSGPPLQTPSSTRHVAASSTPAAPSEDGEPLERVLAVVDRLIARDDIDAAERALSGQLAKRVEAVTAGKPLERAILERTAGRCLDLLSKTGNPAWLDKMVSLYTVAQKPMSREVIDRAAEYLGVVPATSRTIFGAYQAVIRKLLSDIDVEDLDACERILAVECGQ